MLQIGCITTKAGSASSLFVKLGTIHIVQKPMATNLLHGNLLIAKVANLWGHASLFDSTAYIHQHDMTKVEHIQKDKQVRTNERVMNLSEIKLMLPKISTGKKRIYQSRQALDFSCDQRN